MFHRSNQRSAGENQTQGFHLRVTSPLRAQRGGCERSRRSARAGSPALSQISKRAGLTLVELLVVVTILMILLGVVLPLAAPSLNSRKVREAARQVNTAFASAKSRAEGTGRPAGVILNPDPNEAAKVYSLAFAKSPAFFSGSIEEGAGARVDPTSFDSATKRYTLTFVDTTTNSADTTSAAQLTSVMGTNVAFLIRFNHRGRWHVGNVTGGGFNVEPAQGSNAMFIDGVINGVPYQILLPPKRSAAGAFTLPAGTHIDLSHSITQLQTTEFGTAPSGSSPSAVMFDPQNGVGYLFRGASVRRVSGPLALLVVDSEIYDNDPAATKTRVLDAESGSMWVVVNNETGQVKTAENLGHSLASNDSEEDKAFEAARAAAASSKAGGR